MKKEHEITVKFRQSQFDFLTKVLWTRVRQMAHEPICSPEERQGIDDILETMIKAEVNCQ